MRGGVFIKIYDEPLSPKEGACFKIYSERLSPTAGACLRYMKTYGASLRRVQVPYIEAQKTIKNTQKKPSVRPILVILTGFLQSKARKP